VQRLDPEKSNALTLAVLANLKQQIPNFKGLIVGDGKEAGLVKALLNVYNLQNNVKLVPSLGNTELTTEIAKAKTFLSTSVTESFGLAIAESMVIGTPVVVPNIKDLKNSQKMANAVLCTTKPTP
jgi:glycosyltransferase involved in cell wall biosynthesis